MATTLVRRSDLDRGGTLHTSAAARAPRAAGEPFPRVARLRAREADRLLDGVGDTRRRGREHRLGEVLVLEAALGHVQRRPPERSGAIRQRREERVEAQLVTVALATWHPGLEVDDEASCAAIPNGALDEEVRDALELHGATTEHDDEPMLGADTQRYATELGPDLAEALEELRRLLDQAVTLLAVTRVEPCPDRARVTRPLGREAMPGTLDDGRRGLPAGAVDVGLDRGVHEGPAHVRPGVGVGLRVALQPVADEPGQARLGETWVGALASIATMPLDGIRT